MKTLTNLEAFKLLAQGEKLSSIYWNEGYFVQLNENGALISKFGIAIDWNELAKSLKDSWKIFN